MLSKWPVYCYSLPGHAVCVAVVVMHQVGMQALACNCLTRTSTPVLNVYHNCLIAPRTMEKIMVVIFPVNIIALNLWVANAHDMVHCHAAFDDFPGCGKTNSINSVNSVITLPTCQHVCIFHNSLPSRTSVIETSLLHTEEPHGIGFHKVVTQMKSAITDNELSDVLIVAWERIWLREAHAVTAWFTLQSLSKKERYFIDKYLHTDCVDDNSSTAMVNKPVPNAASLSTVTVLYVYHAIPIWRISYFAICNKFWQKIIRWQTVLCHLPPHCQTINTGDVIISDATGAKMHRLWLNPWWMNLRQLSKSALISNDMSKRYQQMCQCDCDMHLFRSSFLFICAIHNIHQHLCWDSLNLWY